MVRDQKVYAFDETERTFYYSPRERGKVNGEQGIVDNIGVICWCEAGELDLRETERVMNVEVVRGFTFRSLYENLFRSRLVHYGEQIIDRWEEKRIMDGRPPFKMDKCWRRLRFQGLVPGARMCGSGGKIVLFWDASDESGYLHIWCTEISLERLRGGRQIWGYIERSSIVMPAVERFKSHKKVLHSLSVTL
ncbi:putative F-box/kelch-repeat protein At3g24610 [Raphanus sativus]|uniref:F-box/kelch-repeat protein At3g24610 n=1 Tax=Raphanus sativus TaxID=3726 RepID=A0A9W3CGY0_RAPSA|nr:putative F-box/kelch-repeat protein At3g24610 [Raphanus sativus]